MENAFARPISTVLSHFEVDEHDGLSNKQVEELRIKYGRNCMSLPAVSSLLLLCPCKTFHAVNEKPHHQALAEQHRLT
jgi:hypothetical protein